MRVKRGWWVLVLWLLCPGMSWAVVYALYRFVRSLF